MRCCEGRGFDDEGSSWALFGKLGLDPLHSADNPWATNYNAETHAVSQGCNNSVGEFTPLLGISAIGASNWSFWTNFSGIILQKWAVITVHRRLYLSQATASSR
jgi:hypothetical protein